MYRVPRPPVWPIEKHVHAEHLTVMKTGRQHGRFDRVKIGTIDKDVDIHRIPGGAGVDLRNPSGDCVAADDGVGNVSVLKCRGRSAQTIAYVLHGQDHPFQNVFAERHDSGCEIACAHDMALTLTYFILAPLSTISSQYTINATPKLMNQA